MPETTDFDIIVIGCGAAGTAAALSAAEAAKLMGKPLRIVIIERADEKNWGGNSRWTGSILRMKDQRTLPPKFEEDLVTYSQGRSDPEVIRAFIENAVDTLQWVSSKGVEFESANLHYLAASSPYITPKGGGLMVITALLNHARALGVHVAFETTAWQLSLNDDGSINVWIRDRDGSHNVVARAVILATGGYEGNAEMLARYVGDAAYHLRMYSPGEFYNRGEGIAMVQMIGGKLSGHFSYFHGGPVDPRSNTVMPLVDAFPYGIVVNQLGGRFVDEGADTVDNNANDVALGILDQPGYSGFVICDQKLRSIPGWERTILTDQPPIEAQSIEELASKIGVPREALSRTVREFNAAVQPGRFNPNEKDAKCTKGIEPPKSNWAMPLDKPPLICYPIVCGLSHTCGGIASDHSGRVLSEDGHVISGLYAAGELTGFYYYRYVTATSVFRALVFGRIAGREAARYAAAKEAR